MKIIFVTPEFITEPNSFDGGLANYLFRVAKALVEFGHEPVVLVAANEDNLLLYEGISVYRVNVNNKLIKLLDRVTRYRCSFLLNWTYSSWVLNSALKKVTRESCFDLIQYASYTATGYFRNRRIPSVVRISAYQPLNMVCYGYSSESLEVKQVKFLERACLKRSDGLFAPSKLMAVMIQDLFNEKVEVIESPYEYESEDNDFSVYDKLLSGKNYLLFFGSVGQLKGVDTIASIIKNYLNQYHDWYFVFIGKNMNYKAGKMMDHVYSRAGCANRERIIYHDRLSHQQLKPIIQNATAVILPSKIDNLPNACIEAMALGKVVIGTRGASFDQLIDDGVNGFLCEIDDPRDLMQTICRVMNLTEQEKNEIGEKAQERINKLRPQLTVKELLLFYESVIKKRNR